LGNGTVAIATGLMIDLKRRISYENARLKAGAPWQTTIGLDLEGMTLALLGLGRLGSRMAEIGRAFRMNIIAWSENLSEERCRAAGAGYVGRDNLFSTRGHPVGPSAIVGAHARTDRRA